MKRYIFTLSALALLAGGCTADLTEQQINIDTESSSAKILNTSDNSSLGSILIRFDASAERRLATRALQGGATRSGIEGVDALLDQVGGYAVEPLFVITDKNRDKVMEMGLHLWYELKFDNEADLDVVAERLAAVAEVQRVQFNEKIVKIHKPQNIQNLIRANSIKSRGTTRATAKTDIPFKDGYNHYQWGLDNQGKESQVTYENLFEPVVEADINAVPAWKLCTGDPSIVVAVVDEGVMYTHDDLKDNFILNSAEQNGQKGVDDDKNGYIDDIYGYNFVTNSATISWNKEGDSGHGTHVAGIVSAVNNNSIGISSIAGGSGQGDGVKVFSVQVFSGEEGADTAASAKAMQYAADRGAHIMQCSWGYDSGAINSDREFRQKARAESDAIDYFVKNGGTDDGPIAGGLAIFAAGNETGSIPGYPSGYINCISVSSFGPALKPAYYTNYGKGVDIGAPGGESLYGSGDILSTVPPELSSLKDLDSNSTIPYGFMQGTSMACPMVSGVAALGLSYAKKLGKRYTVGEFRSILLSATNNFDPFFVGSIQLSDGKNSFVISYPTYRGKMGAGYVDAYKMLLQIDGTAFVTVPTGKDATIDLAPLFGSGVERLTFSSYDMSPEDRAAIGLSSCTFNSGKLIVNCSKSGCATIKVTLLVGGSSQTDYNNPYPVSTTKTFVLMAKSGVASNNGWL